MSKVSEYEYIKYLAEQYALANGIKNIDLNSKAFLSEFNEWLGEVKRMSELYPSFLDSLDVNYNIVSAAEIGKGNYDSAFKNFQTTIITDMPISVDKKRLVSSHFAVIDDEPTIINRTDSFFFHIPISPKKIATYLTQNPYYPELIEDWEKLSNKCGNSIVVGMYGRLIDKDREKKINNLKMLRDKLELDSKIVQATFDGNYYAALFTKKKTKFLSKFFK